MKLIDIFVRICFALNILGVLAVAWILVAVPVQDPGFGILVLIVFSALLPWGAKLIWWDNK